MAYGLNTATWLRLLAWSVIGIAFYFLFGYKNSRLRSRNEAEGYGRGGMPAR
jgi:APA family basic amino acid/polyamine antiporter